MDDLGKFCSTLQLKYFHNISEHVKKYMIKMSYKCLYDRIGKKEVYSKILQSIEKHKTDAITITFGDQAENHAGMQKIGTRKTKGFTTKNLKEIKKNMEAKGLKCEYINLNSALDEKEKEKSDKAGVLIIKGLFDLPKFKRYSADRLFHELKMTKWDTFLVSTRTTQIQNKHARANICISNAEDIPGYTEKNKKKHKESIYWQDENLQYLYDKQMENRKRKNDKKAKLSKEEIQSGKGSVLKWQSVPVLEKFKEFIEKNFGEPAQDLVAEGNSYVNIKVCGIGYHGDSERNIVIAIRLGESFPMHFQWYHRSKPIGKRIVLPKLSHGDVYIMSEKAVGSDWKKSSILTLRHAAGCKKYIK
jgi:hypothetical protein